VVRPALAETPAVARAGLDADEHAGSGPAAEVDAHAAAVAAQALRPGAGHANDDRP